MKTKRLWLYVLLMLTFRQGIAQPEQMPANVRIAFGLPTPVGNPSFKKWVSGIAEVHLGIQTTLGRTFTVGGNIIYHYYKVNHLKSPEMPDGKFHFFAGAVKLGYEKFAGERIFYDFNVRTGYSLVNLYGATCAAVEGRAGKALDAGLYFEPAAGLFLLSEGNLSFGLTFSYAYIGTEFDARDLCLDLTNNIIPDTDHQGAYQSVNIGFVVTVFIGGKRPYKGKK